MIPRLLLFLALVLPQISLAETPPPPKLIKIVHRYLDPTMGPGSFGKRPKTLYIGGETYFRVEEEPDPKERIHGLIICSEPDVWMINLYGRTAQHIVDPGPTFVAHHPILGQDVPGDLAQFEFGKELDFFTQHGITQFTLKILEGKSCEAADFTLQNYRLTLYIEKDSRKPMQIDVFKDQKLEFSVQYLSYETDLPFDASLFKPPADVKIAEAKPNK